MRIICSWCVCEGKTGLIGEKEPLDDPRETHEICKAHQSAVLAQWKESLPTQSAQGASV